MCESFGRKNDFPPRSVPRAQKGPLEKMCIQLIVTIIKKSVRLQENWKFTMITSNYISELVAWATNCKICRVNEMIVIEPVKPFSTDIFNWLLLLHSLYYIFIYSFFLSFCLPVFVHFYIFFFSFIHFLSFLPSFLHSFFNSSIIWSHSFFSFSYLFICYLLEQSTKT